MISSSGGVQECLIVQSGRRRKILSRGISGLQLEIDHLPLTSLFPLPTLRIGVPNTIREQSIQIWKVLVPVDEKIEAFAIFLTRPFSIPHSPTRIATVKMGATKRLPPAVRAWFNVAPVSMEFTYCSTAIWAWSWSSHQYLSARSGTLSRYKGSVAAPSQGVNPVALVLGNMRMARTNYQLDYAANSSSNAFASFRSRVSNPSVNHP
jgi:hypothetical protein